jgi:hypothetical protein
MYTKREYQEDDSGRERLAKRLINPEYKERAMSEGQGLG